MKTRYTVALTLLAGVAIGAVAVEGLHAQAKLKAYVVAELEPLGGAGLQPAYLTSVRKAITDAHGRSLRTLGRVEHIEGAAAPKRVAITEWDSLEQAQAFYNSKAFKDLEPQRNKAVKTIRRFVVEAVR